MPVTQSNLSPETRHESMRGGHVDAEESWCTIDRRQISQTKRAIPVENSRKEQSFTSTMRGLYCGEGRDPPEGISNRDEEPDKIEAHRIEMETQRARRLAMEAQRVHRMKTETQSAPHRKSTRPKSSSTRPKSTSRKVVTQSYYGCEVKTERRAKEAMIKAANRFNDREIIERYMSPGTETNNSAMLFLANSLFSSNQYIFEFLHENGFFNPSSQYVVNSLASDFVTQSQKLSNAILTAERASGEAVRNMIVSCVNNFVATSNKLATVLEEDYTAKSKAAGSAKDNVLNSIIVKRNQISDSLYTYFQRTVDDESPDANTSKATEETARFLEDAQKLTNFLNTEVEKELSGDSNGIEVCGIAKTPTSPPTSPRSELRKKSLFQCHEKESIAGDASDVLSTASSFLDFINGSSLSGMFDEDERDARDSGVSEAHLDVIFERMNISVPTEKKAKGANSSTSEWGNTKQTKPTKLSMREKRKLITIARSQARQARRDKILEKKKARAKDHQSFLVSENKDIWGKMSGIRIGKGRSSSMAEI